MDSIIEGLSKKQVRNQIAGDYASYLAECNEKILITGDISHKALPEHLWRMAPKNNLVNVG